MLFFLFFFSSRRRHTRSLRDWSSDVCSSDLRSAEAYVRKYGELSDSQWLSKAVESGRRAVKTTDDLAAGHVSLGMALVAGDQKVEAAAERSEERRVGKEGRWRWWRDYSKR